MIERGDIVWADLPPAVGHEQAGRRPVLVVSRAPFNSASRTVIAFAMTSSPRNLAFPLTIEVPPGIMPKATRVKLTQVQTLASGRIGKRVGQVPAEFVNRCLAGLLEHCAP